MSPQDTEGPSLTAPQSTNTCNLDAEQTPPYPPRTPSHPAADRPYRLTVNPNGLVLVLKADGISSVIAELAPESGEPRKNEKPQRRKRKGKAPTVTAEEGRITIQIPMRFKRRSGRKEIVLPNSEGKEASAVQESLVTAGELGDNKQLPCHSRICYYCAIPHSSRFHRSPWNQYGIRPSVCLRGISN